MSDIPISNVYYLLLYAWNHVQRSNLIDLAEQPYAELRDLLADALAAELTRLLRRGLHRDYLQTAAAVDGIRGKIDVAVTARRGLLSSGRTFCHFDDLDHDVSRNQIIKATLRILLRVEKLDEDIRARVKGLYRRLEMVRNINLTRRHFYSVQANRLVREYDFALRLCRLIWENTIPDATSGVARFYDFRRDEARMGELFEEFVREFFRLEQRRFKVSRQWIHWYDARGSEQDLARLPAMQTDVILEEDRHCIILDAKFYKDPLVGYRGAQRVISGHLYQVFSYVENRAAAFPDVRHQAMLLYPVVDDAFAFSYQLKGHPVHVRSIDLGQPWHRIHADMLALLN